MGHTNLDECQIYLFLVGGLGFLRFQGLGSYKKVCSTEGWPIIIVQQFFQRTHTDKGINEDFQSWPFYAERGPSQESNLTSKHGSEPSTFWVTSSRVLSLARPFYSPRWSTAVIRPKLCLLNQLPGPKTHIESMFLRPLFH